MSRLEGGELAAPEVAQVRLSSWSKNGPYQWCIQGCRQACLSIGRIAAMWRRGLRLFGLGVLALAMPMAATAAEKPAPPHREVQRPTTGGTAYLGEADGYELAVSNPSPDVALLYVDRVSEGEYGQTYAVTSYAVRPQSSIAGGVLRARFGSIGTVVLRFRPSGKTKVGRARKHCRGRNPQTESGYFQGSVSLRGEGGYFRLQTKRASGVRSRTFRLSCASGQAQQVESKPLYEYVAPYEGFTTGSNGGSIAMLLAVSQSRGRYVYLRAAHMQSSGPGAEVQASVLDREPGIAIGRTAQAEGGEGTLMTSLPGVHPATATLAPPAPFHGEAAFVENSSTSHIWTGTLGVSFPGLDLPLAGPAYATSLCVQSPFKSPVPCDFLDKPVVPE